jgi:hypothetical protein
MHVCMVEVIDFLRPQPRNDTWTAPWEAEDTQSKFCSQRPRWTSPRLDLDDEVVAAAGQRLTGFWRSADGAAGKFRGGWGDLV